LKRDFERRDRSGRLPSRPRRAAPIAAPATLFLVLLAPAAAAQTPETSGAFWPMLDLHAQLTSNLRLLASGELKKDQDVPYQQADFGVGIGRQWVRFSRRNSANIDPDKEHVLVTGLGYEYLHTIQSGANSFENRLVAQVIPRTRPGDPLLLEDRNRIEFRWVDGEYSTRYRNRLSAEVDVALGEVKLAPYASAEFFYDISDGAWKQQQYAAGLRWPYRRLLRVDTYYLRQNCGSCTPEHLNVFGLSLSFFVGSGG
jgi:hypothetical protein